MPADNGTVLVLGGIREAKQIAQFLIDRDIPVIYSIAGLVRQPELDCEIHSGGFSSDYYDGIKGLSQFIAARHIGLIVNATHPYAQTMSTNAVRAAAQQKIRCWRYLRPAWQLDDQNCFTFRTVEELLPRLAKAERPLFTIGQGILSLCHLRPDGQQWIVRSALQHREIAGVTLIPAIGPFSYEQDLALMQSYRIDALVSKNSGGGAVSGKLRAAAQLALPLYLMDRPDSAESGDRLFDDVETICQSLADPQWRRA